MREAPCSGRRKRREFRRRRRGGSAASARGAASLAARAIGTARDCGCTGTIVVRMDSAYYNAAVIGAVRAQGARFSVTVPMNTNIRAAIAAIPGDAWTAIKYPRAVWDDQLDAWISDAEVAEVPYTAFASKKGQAVTARLVVRRVRDLNKKAAAGQDELFPVWRYHAVFTDSPFELVQAEGQHRDHAVVEQVFADVTSGPLAHLPSVISSHPPPVFDVQDATAIRRIARGGRGYLAPSITQMTGGFGVAEHRIRTTERWPAGTPGLFPRPTKNIDGAYPIASPTYRMALLRWLSVCDIRDAHGQPVHLTPHQWRHTLGTRLINRDVPQEVVRRILDHDSAQMTGHYARLHDHHRAPPVGSRPAKSTSTAPQSL